MADSLIWSTTSLQLTQGNLPDYHTFHQNNPVNALARYPMPQIRVYYHRFARIYRRSATWLTNLRAFWFQTGDEVILKIRKGITSPIDSKRCLPEDRCAGTLMRTLQLGASAHRGWGIMRKVCLIGLALAAPGGLVAVGTAQAADPSTKPDFGALASTSVPKGKKAPVNCRAPDAPYKDYSCLDTYLGDGFFERLINYYRLEWGHEGPPADPKGLPGRRDYWPTTPQSQPPMPVSECPPG